MAALRADEFIPFVGIFGYNLPDWKLNAFFQISPSKLLFNTPPVHLPLTLTSFIPTFSFPQKKLIMCDRLKTSTVEVACRPAISCIQNHHYSQWGNRYFSIGIKEHNNDSRWTNELKDRQGITDNDQDNIFFIVSSKMSFVIIITDQLKFDFLANDSLGNSALVLLS